MAWNRRDFASAIACDMPPVTKLKRTRRPHFIKEWRLYRPLTQERAAERCGISRENYGRIENGKGPYNQDVIELLADAFSCDPADLLSFDPSQRDMVWSLENLLRRASPAQRNGIFAVVETMLKTAS